MTKRCSSLQLVLNGEWQVGRLHSVRGVVNGPVELAMSCRGALSSLSVQPQSTQLSATLQVKAVGLNFRDVLNVLGMYPGDPGAPGGDCAGTQQTDRMCWLLHWAACDHTQQLTNGCLQ